MFDLIYYQRYDFTTVPAVRFWNAREPVVTGEKIQFDWILGDDSLFGGKIRV